MRLCHRGGEREDGGRRQERGALQLGRKAQSKRNAAESKCHYIFASILGIMGYGFFFNINVLVVRFLLTYLKYRAKFRLVLISFDLFSASSLLC